jgi:hypothetical protein
LDFSDHISFRWIQILKILKLMSTEMWFCLLISRELGLLRDTKNEVMQVAIEKSERYEFHFQAYGNKTWESIYSSQSLHTHALTHTHISTLTCALTHIHTCSHSHTHVCTLVQHTWDCCRDDPKISTTWPLASVCCA